MSTEKDPILECNVARALVLAFDGLEYDLVEKWNLKNIKQKVYGKYLAPVSPRHGKPHTPSAWVSFITGKSVEEHGIDDWWTYGKLNRIFNWLRWKPPFIWIKGKRKLLRKIGLGPQIHTKKDLKVRTIFDVVKPSIALNIPAYNEPLSYHIELEKALEKGLNEYERKIWEIHRRRVKALMENINKEWKLLMAWFDLADLLGHIYMVKNPLRLLRGYLELNRLVGRVSKITGKDTFIIVVSDHGMKPAGSTGDHSKYGFYSFNMNVGYKPKRITDFYKLILKIIGQ